MENQQTPQATTTASRLTTRRGAIATSILIACAALGWWMIADPHGESTEDAFADGNVVAVTSQVGGVVTAIGADTTDRVDAGRVLVQIDDIDLRLALKRAEAALAKSVRQVRAQKANVGQAQANVKWRSVELRRAEADLAQRLPLTEMGAISGEDARHAKDALDSARAASELAAQNLMASQALVDRTDVESHPDVLAAASQLRDAYIAVQRAHVPAPVGGIVGKRNVQVGQRIAAGATLMSVVPLEQVWVNANFKESQLRHIRNGQPVEITADLYGRSIKYHGTVVGQDAGTGSAFSLLPAQNATGNWVKVVQRVPVRIALDPKELAQNPLQIGLSMRVTVDTTTRDGERLNARTVGQEGRYQTSALAQDLALADRHVESIIQANR